MSLDSLTASFSSIPTDWILLGLVALFAAFIVVRSGSARIANAALALPIASLLYGMLDSAAVVGAMSSALDTPLMQALIFCGIVAATYLVLVRICGSYSSDSGQPIQAAIAGVAFTAILASVWLRIPALDVVWNFSASASSLFGASYSFWWIAASLAALSFIRR